MKKSASIVMTLAMLACACSSGSSGGGGGTGDAGGGTASFSCSIITTSKNECDTSRGVPNNSLSAEEMQCTHNMGGTIVSMCPTTNVIGCCTHAVGQGQSVEGCFYQGETMPTTQSQCMSAGGTYSMTP
jgi:hypothetical protein